MVRTLSKKYIASQKKKLIQYQLNLEKELSRISRKDQKGYHPSFPHYGNEEGDWKWRILPRTLVLRRNLASFYGEPRERLGKLIEADMVFANAVKNRSIKSGSISIPWLQNVLSAPKSDRKVFGEESGPLGGSWCILLF